MRRVALTRPIDSRDLTQAIYVMAAVAEAIRDLTTINGGVPSGELYAILMGRGVGITDYQAMIDKLESARLISVKNHYIRWIHKGAEAK